MIDNTENNLKKHLKENLMNPTNNMITQAMAVTASLSMLLFCGHVTAGELTVEQNMVEQHNLNVKPGKKLTAKGPNYQFCEVAPIMGTSMENAVANFYNPTGLDHCTPEDFEKIVALKDKIIKETGAMDVFLNPSRHWTWDEFEVYEIGNGVTFGPVKFVWMGVVPFQSMKKAVGHGSYNPAQIKRNNKYVYKKGSQVYLIDIAESDGGGVMVMQSWTPFVNKGETAENLKGLGSQFKKLPNGWKFRTKILEQDLTVAPPAPDHFAWVTMDEFQNTYQVCGRDKACNYVP
jgi:hypothetical protein